MTGFVLLALALRGAADLPGLRHRSGRGARRLEGTCWAAVALMLPYYGAEAYGLHEVGRLAVATDDPGVLAVADGFRYAPFEIVTFTVGLIALAAVGVGLARGLWRAGVHGRAGGLLTGVALVTYLPQFAAGPQVRIAHGVVLGVGLLLVATVRVTTPAASGAAPTRTVSPAPA